MNRWNLFIILCFSVVQSAISCPLDDLTGRPVSQFEIPLDEHSYWEQPSVAEGKITEEMFVSALEEIEDIYIPYLRPAGVIFEATKDWKSTYKNAHPARIDNRWIIEMHGEFFRAMQFYRGKDMVSLVGCHEVGHHLGGTNFYAGDYWWASGEGQSDYYSTLKCLRMVWENEDNAAWVETHMSKIPNEVITRCQLSWKDDEDQYNLCLRSSYAGFKLSTNFARKRISFSDPTSKTSKSYIYHPVPRCRLESYVRGAQCQIPYSVPTDQKDLLKGTCNAKTGHTIGLRPDCWYIPENV